jgi:hypothetical protein
LPPNNPKKPNENYLRKSLVEIDGVAGKQRNISKKSTFLAIAQTFCPIFFPRARNDLLPF